MLFRLESDAEGPFDGSTRGIAVLPSPGMEAVARTGGMRLEGASIGLARHPDLDDLQAFTIEATIKPDVVGGSRQSILEGETPAMALYIEADGTLAGAVHTSEDWIQVDSGGTLLRAGVESRISFTRDAAGRLELFVDGASVGVREAPGRITGVGNGGLRIGGRVDGLRHPFLGTVAGVQIRRGTVSPQALVRKRESASRITQAFVAKTGLARVKVSLLPDQGNSRLQPIKDIMNAAGVERLSDLGTLRLRVPTVMTPGKVLVASRKGAVTPGDWHDVVKDFLAANPGSRRDLLARTLTNRNSAAVLGRMPLAPRPGPAVPRPEVATARRILPGGGIAGVGSASTTGPRLSAEVLRSSPTLRLANPAVRPHDLFTRDGDGVALADPAVLTRIASPNPALWANLSAPAFQLLSLTTIPVNSAVMIGSTIDLTDTELVIEPSVTTLYLIAEELVCGDTARITWRRPGGATPPRLANPDLDGRDWPGVQTKPGSRDGQDGGAGGPGEAGIAGAHGLHAPNLEIWVKAMSAMPNLDLNGEDGRQGGRGQLGGHGGDGGDGHVGHRFWFFGWHCDADPGDGGDGGNGGGGGGGGRGGSGGHGGKITIGVLEDTLEATVTSRAFRIKNQGGQRGRGGDGGEGGNGGAAGRSGAGETCHDASDGHPGAKGQPGTVGADGSNPGIDGDVSFFEFTLEEWDALLTRPWLAEVAPTQAFPGDRLTLRGSRFA
ncbi:MAG TPA: LamG-like jellyroll fold domain-containing protein, partial [Gemmatimonadales bacterium]|nr:LamG-like jellyroll fold domain-containing protein [Gemmatimonadales bacterium]